MTMMPAPAVRMACIALLLALAGCAGAPPQPAPPAQAPVVADRFGSGIVVRARTLLGTPYRYGGAGLAGMDCSGLVSFVYAEQGVALPRTAESQQRQAQPLALDQLQPGDLVFFRLPQPHVGLYLGSGEFVHAPGSGRAVTIARLDEPYFLLGFAGGGRYRP